MSGLVESILTARRYTCHTADAVDDALHVLATISFDIIIVDLRLRGKPGDDLVFALRDSGNETPILVLTGTGDQAREVALFRAGVDAYMTKPFDVDRFAAVVSALERRPRSMRRLIRFGGDLILDPVRHEIAWRGRCAKPPKTKFGLIWLLSSHQGAHFSTQKLCLELEGEYSVDAAKRIWEHAELSMAFIRELSAGELELISESKKGYVLRLARIVTL